jgi:GT2 family glycosyltransferase
VSLPIVDVVVVAYGSERFLPTCLTSVLGSVDIEVRIVVVDNGCTRTDLPELTADPRVLLHQPGENLGFAAGCNVGAAVLSGEFVALVNSDAQVAPRALAALIGALRDDVGLVTGCVLLADADEVVNAAGNPVHFLGASWAGGYGDRQEQHASPKDVASVSGAAAAVRRDLWDQLGGFEPSLFLYCEDMDLSLRVWQRGLRVRYVPSAVVWHHYEFSRTERKLYFLERNRLAVILTVLQGRTLLLMLPALFATELALIAAAAAQGRVRAKLSGYGWLIRHGWYLRERRRRVQAQRRRPDSWYAHVLTGRIDSPVAQGPAVAAANLVLPAYWRAIRRLL